MQMHLKNYLIKLENNAKIFANKIEIKRKFLD